MEGIREVVTRELEITAIGILRLLTEAGHGVPDGSLVMFDPKRDEGKGAMVVRYVEPIEEGL